MPTPTGTACPSLPQVPTPSSSFRSLPTMETRVSTSGPLPISVAPLIGAVILAVFDQVGLRRGEHKFAVGDVDLAAAEIHRVDAILHGANDVFGIVLPGEHVGVGHARHGNVLVAFAAAVAGVGHAHQAGGKLVAQISLENSVFDQDRVSCVGWPSSSTLSEPRRQGMVPLSTTVHFSLATRLPIKSGESRSLSCD